MIINHSCTYIHITSYIARKQRLNQSIDVYIYNNKKLNMIFEKIFKQINVQHINT